MELLQELLTIQDDNALFEELEELFEDLGQLKKIDKDLFKIFVKPKERGGSDKDKAQKVRGALGQNSKIEEHDEANQNTAWKRLEDDKIAKALILKYDGEQIFAAIKTTAGSYKEKPQFSFILKPTFFEKITDKAEYNKAMGGVKTKTSRYGGRVNTWDETTEFEAGRASEGTSTTTTGKIKTVMKMVFDAAKKNKADLKVMIVTIDEARIAKSHERVKARSGSLPLPTGNKVAVGGGKMSTYDDVASNYFKSLKSDLKSRLETYKASKAKAFDTPNDLLSGLIKDGYFEKLKFMGYTYKFYQDRINFRGMKGDKFYGESYIEYKIQPGTPEYKKAEEDVAKLRSEMSEKKMKAGSDAEKEALQTAYYDERKKLLPPAEFKVVLGLKGGVITPEKIEIGRDEAWF